MQPSYLLDGIIDLSLQAGEILLRIQKSGVLGVEIKEDKSPVTQADKEADILITAGLKKISHLPVISEEGVKDEIPETDSYWLVDPLDGTKSFIRGEPEYTVNIGLIENNRPKLGVVYQPVTGSLYYGEVGVGAWKVEVSQQSSVAGHQLSKKINLPLTNHHSPTTNYRIVASKSHLDPETKKFIEKYQSCEVVSAASSLKFCMVAEGSADIYPRFGPTMQWDTAAGHAVLSAAGGKVTNPDGSEFIYKLDKTILDYLRNGSFVAWGRG